MIKNMLAGIGLYFVVLWVAGTLGFAHLYVYFGAQPVTCAKEPQT